MGDQLRRSGTGRRRSVAGLTAGVGAAVAAGCLTAVLTQPGHPAPGTDAAAHSVVGRAVTGTSGIADSRRSASASTESGSAEPLPSGAAPTGPDGAPAGPAHVHGMLVVGASYTAGVGARKHTDGYAYQLGRELGWRTDVVGIAGTGYVNEGPHGQGSFAYQIEHVHPPFRPDVVLIQGGRNDVGVSSGALREAVDHTIAVTRDRFGDPAIALLGPIPGKLPVDPRQRGVERVLDGVATRDRVLFIDPLAEGWINPSNLPGFRGSVPGHPNAAGYAYIAERVSGDLKHWSQDKTA